MYKKIITLLIVLSIIVSGIIPSSEVEASNDPIIIVLDPGHGGTDPGAISNGIYEKNINLTIATYMKAALDEYSNVEVYMTRTTDTYLTLEERAIVAAEYDADLLISIHANSSTSSSANGVEVYYPNSNYTSNFTSSISYSKVKTLAQNLVDGLADLGLKNLGIKIRNSESNTLYDDGSLADYYGVIRESKIRGIPTILIEHGFLSNTSDRTTYLNSNAKLKTLALANVETIVETLGLTIVSAELTITAPTKTEYIVGESLDTTGLTVKAKYSDGTSKTLTSSDYTLSGFSSSSTGNKLITITHENATSKFLVTILPVGTDLSVQILGDVNGDSTITASDYLLIKDSFLNGITLSSSQIARADVKQDGSIKASDYLMLKDYFLGILASLPELESSSSTDSTTSETDSTTSETDASSDSTTSETDDASSDSTTSETDGLSTDSTTPESDGSSTDSTTPETDVEATGSTPEAGNTTTNDNISTEDISSLDGNE